MKKNTFALFFGHRGIFPGDLVKQAREDLTNTLQEADYDYIMMPEEDTNFGAVETSEEGRKYAKFLKQHDGEYDGVILSLPNFGDENGAAEALKNCGVPIFIQAYPDEIGKLGFSTRRDAFCGKFSIMDVFNQYGIPFTIFEKHTVHPLSDIFKEQLNKFASICRVVAGMKNLTIGVIGSRVTPFKSVRYDEVALQRLGITTEVIDLGEFIYRLNEIDTDSTEYQAKVEDYNAFTCFSNVPEIKFERLVKTGVLIDKYIEEYKMDCVAVRCWTEFQNQLGISPCVVLGELAERKIAAACEVDVCNALVMHALTLASDGQSTCLDWNNNWGDEDDKCILFHCGPVPDSMMKEKGEVTDHKMFAKTVGKGCGWGSNEGRIKPSEFTFSSSKTDNGKLYIYVDEGRITEDVIEDGFFGCGGVAEIKGLQKKICNIGKMGYKHHVSLTFGKYADAMKEAFSYLGYEVTDI